MEERDICIFYFHLYIFISHIPSHTCMDTSVHKSSEGFMAVTYTGFCTFQNY